MLKTYINIQNNLIKRINDFAKNKEGVNQKIIGNKQIKFKFQSDFSILDKNH